MKKLSSELNLRLIIQESIFILLLSFSRRLHALIRYFFKLSLKNAQRKEEKRAEPEETGDQSSISREDIDRVMKKMGLCCRDNETSSSWKAEEIAALFQDQEPGLDEAKEAFAVFDENGDGFVDTGELQRALCRLGFREEGEEEKEEEEEEENGRGGSNCCFGLDSCRKMIEVHDEDRDGLIGFSDFVKLVECSFG